MKTANPDQIMPIDVRTRAEVKYIGMADAVDANIPVRMLREDYSWSDKSNTYRTPGKTTILSRRSRFCCKNEGLPWSYEFDPAKIYFNFMPR